MVLVKAFVPQFLTKIKALYIGSMLLKKINTLVFFDKNNDLWYNV
jgi:hypothetical protein